MAMIPAALTAIVRDSGARRDDFASLRVCRSGSDKVSLVVDDESSALTGFLINEGDGMTEVGLATLNPPEGPIKCGSMGSPVSGFEVELRAPDSEVGRIWIRTRSRMSGYWQNPEATARVIDEDGWIDSGDLAHCDDDGYLWCYGRSKQIIVHDGSNICPFEVEEALLAHPGVALAGVVGIHDEVHGENVRAHVTRSPGDGPTAQELIDSSGERVGYKAPEEVVFVPEMPLNAVGKVNPQGAASRSGITHAHDAITAA